MAALAPTVEDYLAALARTRAEPFVEGLRATIRLAAPDAVETIAYAMPAFRLDGRFCVSYAAYKDHYSLFPASGAVVAALGDELAPYLAGKGTIRFRADRPIPLGLVSRIVEVRPLQEHAASGRR